MSYSVRMIENQVKTAMVGLGRWGKNVAREMSEQSDLVGYVVREGSENRDWATTTYPRALALTLDELVGRNDIEAIAVATPFKTHYAIVRALLESGKHVLCEKPLAENSREATELAKIADTHGVTLTTGYVFLYHPVYQELKKMLRDEHIVRIAMEWEKYGTFGEPIEFSLLTHHLALAFDMAGMPTNAESKRGEGKESACDILDTELRYDAFSIHSHINRISTEKRHSITVETQEGNTYTWNDTKLTKRSVGNDEILFESTQTSLNAEVRAFLQYSQGGTAPVSAGSFGADVLRIHEMFK